MIGNIWFRRVNNNEKQVYPLPCLLNNFQDENNNTAFADLLLVPLSQPSPEGLLQAVQLLPTEMLIPVGGPMVHYQSRIQEAHTYNTFQQGIEKNI